MVARDLKVRYSQSVLGVVWSLFNPLLMTLVYYVVFTYMLPSGVAKFPVFILAGLLPWNYLTATVAGSTSSVTANGHLINRVYFPREVLPVATLFSHGVNFVIGLGLLFVFIFAFGVRLGPSVALLPVLALIQATLMLGLSLLLAAVNVFFRDTQQLVEVGLLAWFFLTPVIYPLDVIKNASLRLALQVLNPMASLVAGYRHVLYQGDLPDPALLGVTALQAALVLLVGAVVFQRLSPRFAEEI